MTVDNTNELWAALAKHENVQAREMVFHELVADLLSQVAQLKLRVALLEEKVNEDE